MKKEERKESLESSQLTTLGDKKRNLEGESFSLSGLSLLIIIIIIIREKKKKREKIKERGSLLLVWFQQIGAYCDRGQYVYIHTERREIEIFTYLINKTKRDIFQKKKNDGEDQRGRDT